MLIGLMIVWPGRRGQRSSKLLAIHKGDVMKTIMCALVLVAVVLVHEGLGSQKSGPSIEGNYILDYRERPDGKKVRSPEIIGFMTYTKTHRNLNVYWTENGKPTSVSIVSKYTLSAKEYSEDGLYMAANEAGKGIAYETTATHAQSPVTVTDGKIRFQLPLHGEPELAFEAGGFTATRQGVFIDHWKKID